MSDRKPTATVADRLAALERDVSAIKRQLRPTEPPVIPWWVKAYPEAYRSKLSKE